MTKAKFFLMAAAPAALIVPIDAYAAAEQVTIVGNGLINSDLKVDIPSLPEDPSYKYQWYYVDGSTVTEIDNETNSTFKIPEKALGKTIIVKVTNSKGKVYESKKIVAKGNLPIGIVDYINGKLVADIERVKNPNDPDKSITFSSYQWFIIDGNTVKPIKGATKNEIIVPVEASDKQIFIEAKTVEGLVFVSENKYIKKLDLSMADLEFEGFSKGNLVVPGDTLKVKVPELKTDVGSSKIPLNTDQISYSYQWLYKVGENYSFIPNATAASYTISKDAMDSDMKQIVVKVTAKVGNETVSKIALVPMKVSDEHITPLIEQIDELLSKKDNKVTYVSDIKSKASTLEEFYQSLTPAAKSQVKNYSILKRALEDIKKVENIVEKINSIDKNSSQQQLLTLKAEYDQLDYLQRSLDTNDAYKNLLDKLIENPNGMNELSKLKEINAKILDLLDSNKISVPTYKVTTTTELDSLIQNIEKEINTLSNDYKAAVQNREILTMAKADVKNAQKFEKLFDKLNGQTAQQKVTTAKNIRTAYLKLSLRQQGLVDSKLNELEDAENAESSAIAELEALIDNLKEPVDTETWNKYVADVNLIISKQKSLKSYQDVASKNEFIQKQKDLKAAEKVITQIIKYESLLKLDATKNSTLQSTYNSALKAFNKLTKKQQEYVYNKDILNKVPENNGNTSSSESDDATAGKEFSNRISNIPPTNNSDFHEYATNIEKLTNEYKNVLPKGARKYVTNYSDLKTAETNVKAVRSYEKKVNDALNESNSNKRYSKMQDAIKAYNKLNASQQELAGAFYSKVVDAIKEYASSKSDLNDQLSNLKENIDDNKYSFVLEEVKGIINDYNSLSSAEKKIMENGQVIKQATSDVKAIESFIKKYHSNIDKNPSSIIKDFRKLTSLQVSLLDGELLAKIIDLETSGQTDNDIALDIIESINILQENGYYVENLEDKVTKIKEDYNKLTTAQKNLVKNYSKLTQAESDLQKVKAVEELKADIEAWQKAYNKLTKKLEKLYDDRN